MVALTASPAGLAPPYQRLHEHLRQLLKGAWKDYQRSFRRCRVKLSAGSVHRLRVESRRLLALLALLETLVGPEAIAPPRRLVKKGLRLLARLRDTQVQLLEVEHKQRALPEIQSLCETLRARERRLIRRIGARMHRARMGRIKSAMVNLHETVRRLLADQPHEQQHWEALLRSVNQAFACAVERGGACRATDLKTVHRLRIAFKRFRYMIELLQPVVPGVTRRQLETLHAFQTRLGEIQDADVLLKMLGKYTRKRPEEARILERFRRDVERRRRCLVGRFLARVGRIREFWPPSQSRRDTSPSMPRVGTRQAGTRPGRPPEVPVPCREESELGAPQPTEQTSP
jgi:CHAD domain-containing protein